MGGGQVNHNESTSTIAWKKAWGASWGRLCPIPPVIFLCAYLPVNLLVYGPVRQTGLSRSIATKLRGSMTPTTMVRRSTVRLLVAWGLVLACLFGVGSILEAKYGFLKERISAPRFPLHWYLGKVDPRFGISETTIRTQCARAIHLWEAAAHRTLFVNSQDETAFPINFVFGVAQDKLNDRRGAKAKIAALDSALQESKRIHREAAAQFEDAKSRIELEESALKFKLDRYNHTVESWNSSGGALAEVVDQLTQEKQDISDEKAQVERDIPEVEALRSNANSLADESNRKLEEYDKAVRAFNSKFGSEISVVLGECRSNSLGVESIQIYGYKDEDDLAFVLAHELGHALGLGHVKGEGAIMSAVEKGEKRAAKFELTPRDLKELQTAMKRAGG